MFSLVYQAVHVYLELKMRRCHVFKISVSNCVNIGHIEKINGVILRYACRLRFQINTIL